MPTVFRWHGKMEFKCHLHFSFSNDIEKQIWILLSVFRFRLTLKNGFEFHFSIFVFASLWKTDLNFVFVLCLLLKNRLELCLSFFFQRNAKTKNEKQNSYPFFDAKTKNEIRSAKPFFKVRRKRKTKSKIQICFSMSCENEKWKWHLNSLFSCHRKTAGTKVHALQNTVSWPILPKRKMEKWPIFDQNHGLTPSEKSQFFDFLIFLFLKPILPKKKWITVNFWPKPWFNPFGKTSIFRLFELLFL